MTLEALLKLLREGILNDRTDRIAGTSDYLWTDELLVTYINEAQRRLAVKGLVLRDGTTPEVTEFALVEGQTQYVLHPSIVAVITAKPIDLRADLSRIGHSLLSGYHIPAEGVFDVQNYTNIPAGPPRAFSTDEELSNDASGSLSRVTLRIFPEPNAAAAGTTIKMRVVRKPINELTLDDLNAHPEVPEDHHIEMLDWAAYLALRIVDDDAGAAARAREFASNFQGYVMDARSLAMRKLFAPTQWGFGRGGFSWSNDYG